EATKLKTPTGRMPMPLCKLIALTTPVAGREQDYHDWYNNVHLPELVNGLGLSVNAASLDSDGDGMSNQREYNAGTDPLSATSRLRVTGLATDSKNTVTLQFSALAGKLYRVSTSDDLLTWTPLSSPAILPTATGTQTVTLPYLRKPAAFYRVEIVP
ncbi:MAG: thrombospondin type 3 repeat-containing protein, partial [Verrucomicrobiota bacterium]